MAANQQHLSPQEDGKEGFRVVRSPKATFLQTGFAKPWILAVTVERKCGFAENIQVKRKHILSGPGIIFVKNNIQEQAPMQLVFNRSVTADCMSETRQLCQRRNEITGIYGSFSVFCNG